MMLNKLVFLGILFAVAIQAYDIDPLSDDMMFYINHVANSTWKAGKQTRFQSLDALKAQMGAKLRRNYSRPRQIIPLDQLENDDDLPETFDAREHWPHCPTIAQIRDQSACASCWDSSLGTAQNSHDEVKRDGLNFRNLLRFPRQSLCDATQNQAFGAATAMSDRICIHSNGALTQTLSAEDLLSCCEHCGEGCYGGFPLAAWQYFRDSGLVTGGEYGDKECCRSYTYPHCDHYVQGRYTPCGSFQSTPECRRTCQPGYPKLYQADKIKGKNAYNVRRASLRREIYKNGPVEAAFELHTDFMYYKSGVYVPTVPQVVGGHAVRMLGWGVENGVKYWLLANSWNEDWGDKGLFKIKRGDDTCGIESEVVAGIPDVDSFKNDFSTCNI